MNLLDLAETLYDSRPTPTLAQAAAERAAVAKLLANHAPDLLDMVLGDAR